MSPAPRPETVSFLSDYGTDDEFVGVVHSVIRSIAPQAAIVDLTHGIAPHDVRAAGLALARTVQYVATPGVILAVVDPGVGTARRAIAVEVGDGQSYLVGPDNGLLAPAVSMVGGADRAVSLTNAEFQLPAPGPTFAGRDGSALRCVAFRDAERLAPLLVPGSRIDVAFTPQRNDYRGADEAEAAVLDVRPAEG